MQLDQLTNFSSIDKYFNLLCHQSKKQILDQLFSDKKKILSDIGTFQNQLLNVFYFLFNHFPQEQTIVQSLAKLFQLDLNKINQFQGQARRSYIMDRIGHNIGVQLTNFLKRTAENVKQQKLNEKKSKRFDWIDLKTKYTHLKEVFQQILLQKVRQFDNQLTALVNSKLTKKKDRKNKQIQTPSTLTKTLSKSLIKTSRSKTNIHKLFAAPFNITNKSQQQKIMDKIDFSNISIRDTTKFLMQKWGETQQKQFVSKKKQLRKNFHKVSNTPIIFQFVKKYTQTTKARQYLLKRWNKQQCMKEQELRYLCATSIFLNNTITKSQKNSIKQKIQILHDGILSKLEFNIAQKIIQTYREFTNKVSDLRKNYYLQMTRNTKKNQKQTMKIQFEKTYDQQRYQLFLKYKNRFQNICNSQHMKFKLNYKILRWVRQFISNLKQKYINKKNKLGIKIRSTTVMLKKKFQNSNLQTSRPYQQIPLSRYKHPSSKIIKKQLTNSIESQKQQQYIQKQIKYAKSFNRIRIKNINPNLFKKFNSSGPKKIATSLIKVDNITRKITYCQSTLNLIIYVQACWKGTLTRIKFKKAIQIDRQNKKQQFKKLLHNLKFLYPPGIRINLSYVKKRIKKDLDRKTAAIFDPYHKLNKIISRKYLHFSDGPELSEAQLARKYHLQNPNNMKVKIQTLIHYIKNNALDRITKSGFIFTAKELNMYVQCKTVLHWACQSSNLGLIRLLLASGGNPNIKDDKGNTCLHIGFMNRNASLITTLMQYGGDLNIVNNEMQTPLYHAPVQFLKYLGLQCGIVSSLQQIFTGDNNLIYFKGKQIGNNDF